MPGALGFDGRVLRIDSLQVELEYPIAEAFPLGELAHGLLCRGAVP
jgi:hypothetical protein